MSDRDTRGIHRGWGIVPRRPGKLRQRLEQLLAQKGFTVRAAEIFQNAPAYRTAGEDGVAWEVYGQQLGDVGTVQLHSWDTMKECCKLGVVVRKVGEGCFEVSADDKAKG